MSMHVHVCVCVWAHVCVCVCELVYVQTCMQIYRFGHRLYTFRTVCMLVHTGFSLL